MVLEGVSVSSEYQQIWDTMPFSTLHVVYLAIVGRIKFSRICEELLLKDINVAKHYLQHWKGRWKISSMS
jgi:hypothetical protein